jgi:hypothetical protein
VEGDESTNNAEGVGVGGSLVVVIRAGNRPFMLWVRAGLWNSSIYHTRFPLDRYVLLLPLMRLIGQTVLISFIL